MGFKPSRGTPPPPWFERKDGEHPHRYLDRLHAEPLFADATDAELADFTQLSYAVVATWRKRQWHAVLEHAQFVAKRVGWDLDPKLLISIALERYRVGHDLRR